MYYTCTTRARTHTCTHTCTHLMKTLTHTHTFQAYVTDPPAFFQDAKYGTDARSHEGPLKPIVQYKTKHLVFNTVCRDYGDNILHNHLETNVLASVKVSPGNMEMEVIMPLEGIHGAVWPEIQKGFSVAYLTDVHGGRDDDRIEVARWRPKRPDSQQHCDPNQTDRYCEHKHAHTDDHGGGASNAHSGGVHDVYPGDSHDGHCEDDAGHDAFKVRVPAQSVCWMAQQACAFHLELLDEQDEVVAKGYRLLVIGADE